MAAELKKKLENADGIIVEATVEDLRKAALEVLWEYEEIEETPPDIERPSDGRLRVGEALLFREKIQTCPAEMVAVKLNENNLWFIMSTHECPPEKCATTREAMKCAESELKRLRKFRAMIQGSSGTKVEEVQKWAPDKLADAQSLLQIIDDAYRRYSH